MAVAGGDERHEQPTDQRRPAVDEGAGDRSLAAPHQGATSGGGETLGAPVHAPGYQLPGARASDRPVRAREPAPTPPPGPWLIASPC